VTRDERYQEAAAAYGAALDRLAHAYEPDADRRRDLLQEIHVALWKSFSAFDSRCSLRTWVYRVAHNVAISEVARRRARTPVLVGLEALESTSDGSPPPRGGRTRRATRIQRRIDQLPRPD
jgi:RNA polymerase sigma-70 factor (ECF subfamily)